jgi:hypothetical protein
MDTQNARARVLVIDRDTGKVVAECHGASAFGMCPQAATGEVVPCAGRRLVPVADTGFEGWALDVTDSAVEACPLAFLPVRDVA